jgi:thymidylate synthase
MLFKADVFSSKGSIFIAKNYTPEITWELSETLLLKKVTGIDTSDLECLELEFYYLDSVNDNGLLVYKRTTVPCSQEERYLNLITDVLENGSIKTDRTGTGTVSLFGKNLTFDIKEISPGYYQIPVLTTKYTAWKTCIKELLFFLKGYTDTNLLEESNVNIWKGNTSREFLNKQELYHYHVGEMGPMYGFQFRHYDADYCGSKPTQNSYKDKGLDQLQMIIDRIKKDPDSRRLLLTSFNPSQAHQGVLYPCHSIVLQFYVSNGTLDLQVYNRSQDLFLGVPINIMSHCLFLVVVAKNTGLKPGRVIIQIGDAHVYSNHIKQCESQLMRPRRPFPVVKINGSNIDTLTFQDFELLGYFPGPIIRGDMAV